jgi:hypothetical protein
MAFTISINDQAAFEVLFAGPAGPTGPQGPQGIQGVPGVGVPAGGTTGQVLAKVDGVNYNTEWITPQDEYAVWGGITGTLSAQVDLQAALDGKYSTTNPAGFITSAALVGYATESYVNSQGFITASALTPYLTKAGNLSGLTDLATARDNLQLGLLNSPTFAGLTIQGAGANVAQLTSTALSLNHTGYGQFTIQPSTGITFPDASVQTTAFTAALLSGYATESWVTAGFYPLEGNPASFATESWVTSQGYATESWVTSQGYLTTAILDGYAELSGAIFTGFVNFKSEVLFDENGYLDVAGTDSANRMRIRFGAGSGGSIAWGDFGFNGTYLVYGNGENQLETVASQTWVKAGVTFTGKVNMAAPTAGSASLNLGVGTAPTTSVAGDIWIATNINYKDAAGTQKAVANTNTSNTYTAPQIIQTTVGTVNAALRVTQLGTGNALLVEDSTTPDTSALVVDASGNVGVGVATGYTSTSKLEVVGNVKGTTLSTASGPAFSLDSIVAHTGGSDTNDLLVTIGGVNYRIGMRIV